MNHIFWFSFAEPFLHHWGKANLIMLLSLKVKALILYMWMFCLHIYLCTHICVQCPQSPKPGIRFPGTEVTNVDCSISAGSQPSPLEEQPVLLAGQPSLQPHKWSFWCDFEIGLQVFYLGFLHLCSLGDFSVISILSFSGFGIRVILAS